MNTERNERITSERLKYLMDLANLLIADEAARKLWHKIFAERRAMRGQSTG
jgi:hypothetical protein